MAQDGKREVVAAGVLSSRRLQVNGITINVFDQGEGPAVLLVHGMPGRTSK